MIVAIEGILERATPLAAIIKAGGLSYLVHIPVTTAARLPKSGETARLHTCAVYREDAQALYGFTTEEERDFFALLVEKVSGVGPKVAIGMMSKLELPALIAAISNEDAALLAKTPGIGKKTAERVVIELKDKLAAFSHPGAGLRSPGGAASAASGSPSAATGAEASEDAIKALEALGYRRAEAAKSVVKAMERLGKNASVEALIKSALG